MRGLKYKHKLANIVPPPYIGAPKLSWQRVDMDQGCMFTYTTTKHTQTMFRLNFKHIHRKNPTLNTNIYLQVNWYSNGFPIGKDMQLQLVDICWPCLTTWRVNGTLWLYCEVCKHNGIVPSWGFLLFKTHDQIRCLWYRYSTTYSIIPLASGLTPSIIALTKFSPNQTSWC